MWSPTHATENICLEKHHWSLIKFKKQNKNQCVSSLLIYMCLELKTKCTGGESLRELFGRWPWIRGSNENKDPPLEPLSINLSLQFLSHTYVTFSPLLCSSLWPVETHWLCSTKSLFYHKSQTWIDETEERVVGREAAVPLKPPIGASTRPLDGQNLWLQRTLSAADTGT